MHATADWPDACCTVRALLALATDLALAYASIPFLIAALGMTLRPDLVDLLAPLGMIPAVAISGAVFLRRTRASTDPTASSGKPSAGTSD